MRVVIDRIENDRIVVELPNKETVNVSRRLFSDAEEGDIYIMDKDSAANKTRRKQIEKKMQNLFVD